MASSPFGIELSEEEAGELRSRAARYTTPHGEVLRVARLDFNTAYAYEQLGQTGAALEWYATVAASCQEVGTPEAADLLVMTRVNQAIALAPGDAYSLSMLGYLRFKQEKYDEALEWYRRALAGQEKSLGKDHQDTISTNLRIEELLREQRLE